uniref:Uncharacterized protein n=1 Tax=Gossypium raimondii TaxID=29730 RepID=A0A0D2SQK1_GOSRA|nr:hypothetical protein B456_007G242200 [Gossypium raimondii]
MDSTTIPETETPSSSTGSLLIRAPLTLDSNSDYELETASTVGRSSVYNYENNSELGGSEEGFLSGNEEFETGSEKDRPLDGDPDEGIELGGENNGGVSERYKIYVANKDDDIWIAWRIQWRMRKRAVVLMFLLLRCQWMMKCYSYNLAPKLLV